MKAALPPLTKGNPQPTLVLGEARLPAQRSMAWKSLTASTSSRIEPAGGIPGEERTACILVFLDSGNNDTITAKKRTAETSERVVLVGALVLGIGHLAREALAALRTGTRMVADLVFDARCVFSLGSSSLRSTRWRSWPSCWTS